MTRYKRLCLLDTDIEGIPGVREPLSLKRGREYHTTATRRATLTVLHGGREYPYVRSALFGGAKAV